MSKTPYEMARKLNKTSNYKIVTHGMVNLITYTVHIQRQTHCFKLFETKQVRTDARLNEVCV